MEYEQSLSTAPNRFNSLYGAARSAELSGKTEKAEGYYRELIEMIVNLCYSRLDEKRAVLWCLPWVGFRGKRYRRRYPHTAPREDT